MEVLVVAGAGLAIAAAVNAAQKNNPDRKMAQQEKAAYEALKKAQSKRNPNPAEIAQLEQNAKAITIERTRQTMERSEHKMVKYRQEGQIAKAEKHSKRAASLRAELQRTAPHVLNPQYQQQVYPNGTVMAAIPIANGAHSPQPEKGTYVQWPPSQQQAGNQQGPYTLGDYMGASNTQSQHQPQPNYQYNQSQSSQPQPNYQFNQPSQQYGNQHHQPQPNYSQHGSNLPEAREVLRTPAVSPLPQFQGSQSSQPSAANGAFSYDNRSQQNAYSSNNFPVAAPAAAHKSSSGPRSTLPEAREVLRQSDARPLAQFQQTTVPNGTVHIDLTNGPRADAPPPGYTPREAEFGHASGQQAYQNIEQNNPPPAYNPPDWASPSKK